MSNKHTPQEEHGEASSPPTGFTGFLWRTKYYWLPPILLALLLLAALYYMAGESDVVAPFVYDL